MSDTQDLLEGIEVPTIIQNKIPRAVNLEVATRFIEEAFNLIQEALHYDAIVRRYGHTLVNILHKN